MMRKLRKPVLEIIMFIESVCHLEKQYKYVIDFCLFSAAVSGYDHCWIFGDDFAYRSFERFFKSRTDLNSYTLAHFDTSGYFNNAFSMDNPSIISRVVNLLMQAATCKQVNQKFYRFQN